MKLLRSLPAALAAIVVASGLAWAGMFSGFPFASLTATSNSAATLPMTGAECIPGDTNLSGGRAPQTSCYKQGDIKGNYNVALTDAATISWDMSQNANMYRVVLGGNRTMAAPTNQTTGQVTYLFVQQDGTGSRTLTWNSVFKWPATAAGGQPTAPTLTTTGNRVDIFQFISDGTNLFGQPWSIGTASQNRVP